MIQRNAKVGLLVSLSALCLTAGEASAYSVDIDMNDEDVFEVNGSITNDQIYVIASGSNARVEVNSPIKIKLDRTADDACETVTPVLSSSYSAVQCSLGGDYKTLDVDGNADGDTLVPIGSYFSSWEIRGGQGKDQISSYVTSGKTVLDGGLGADFISGSVTDISSEKIYGGQGDDTLCGSGGEDSLFGESGNDSFYTQDGEKDKLDGGSGTDSAIDVDDDLDSFSDIEYR